MPTNRLRRRLPVRAVAGRNLASGTFFVDVEIFIRPVKRYKLTVRRMHPRMKRAFLFLVRSLRLSSPSTGSRSRKLKEIEVPMGAYLFLLIAVLSRLALAATPHPEWFNFTAVGGMLLYFGARRSWREMLAPLAVLMATDYFLTVSVYHYAFQWQSYIPTWAWYVAAMVLGQILLHAKTTFVRVAAGALLGPTSFFLMSNFAAWKTMTDTYPRTLGGLGACYTAGLPFYRNDLISTALVAGVAFGLPVLVRRFYASHAAVAEAGH